MSPVPVTPLADEDESQALPSPEWLPRNLRAASAHPYARIHDAVLMEMAADTLEAQSARIKELADESWAAREEARKAAAQVSFLEAAVEREARSRHRIVDRGDSGRGPLYVCAGGCRVRYGESVDEEAHAAHVALEVAKALGAEADR